MDKLNNRGRKQAMRDRRREMLKMNEEDGYSGPEIAKKYGIKVQGVYAQLKKARRERGQERRLATQKEQELQP
jgi:hypothetical protein